MTALLHPTTGRPFGKPAESIVARICHTDSDTHALFDRPAALAYFFANAAEAPSCWPRVIDGTMTQERFHERTKRMQTAILKAAGIAA